MPHTKIPLTYHFGIISQGHKSFIEEQILQKNAKNHSQELHKPLPVLNDLFITKYNNAHDTNEKLKYDNLAVKFLERIKRRCGLQQQGVGEHLNIPLAWTELAQLAQCIGPIQEKSLETLLISLDQVPMCSDHIPTLCFLAETMLRWLDEDAVQHTYVKVAELKVLKIGFLCFLRLYWHHMAGHLQEKISYLRSLDSCLKTIDLCQSLYEEFPDAVMWLRFMQEVGNIINVDVKMSNVVDSLKDEPEATTNTAFNRNPELLFNQRTLGLKPVKTCEKTDNFKSLNSAAVTLDKFTSTKGFDENRNDKPSKISKAFPQMPSPSISTPLMPVSRPLALSACVHDLSPSLWHSLDIWRCVTCIEHNPSTAVNSYLRCAQGISSENWVDSAVALFIVGEAATRDISAMKMLQDVCCGFFPPPSSTLASHTLCKETKRVQTSQGDGNENDTYSEQNFVDAAKPTPSPSQEILGLSSKRLAAQSVQAEVNMSQNATDDIGTPVIQNGSSNKSDKMVKNSENPNMKSSSWLVGDPNPSLLWYVYLGEGFLCQHATDSSSALTFTNLSQFKGLRGLSSWGCELALIYVDVLTSVILRSGHSDIQKIALIGRHETVSDCLASQNRVSPLRSAGLIDLAFFRSSHISKTADGESDWSWKVRYATIKGLATIYQQFKDESMKDGIRDGAWRAILAVRRKEHNKSVLFACKVGEIKPLVKASLPSSVTTIGGKLASLADIYLPPLRAELQLQAQPQINKAFIKNVTPVHRFSPQPRISLREEMDLAMALYQRLPDYYSRTSFTLRRVVEDQWRKQLHELMEDNEDLRLEELQNMFECTLDHLHFRRAKKLKKFEPTTKAAFSVQT